MSVILMYHRVAAPKLDPYGISVHPDRFAAHMEVLLQLGGTVPLQDIVGTGPGQRVAITFDDGYADNATVAAPLLAAAGIPATWFITTDRLGARRFWWDRLAEGLLRADAGLTSIDVEVAGQAIWLDLRDRRARTAALHFLHRRLRPLPPDSLEESVDRITRLLGPAEAATGDLTMTVDQLRHLALLPLQEVGGHTRTHIQLGGQAERLQRAEVLGSVTDLTELLGRPVLSFAYPFGTESAVGALAPRLVAEAGCRVACSTNPGRVRRRGDRYLLPRLYVQDWHRDEFSARLRSALQGR